MPPGARVADPGSVRRGADGVSGTREDATASAGDTRQTTSPDRYREALSHVATSVSVVTAYDSAGAPYGVTIGSLCALSLTPPLVMFCADLKSSAAPVFQAAPRFLVHVLNDEQQPLARRFTAEHQEPFGERYPKHDGMPTLRGALTVLTCRRDELVVAGDHVIVIGAVTRVRVGGGDPLLYYRRAYHALPIETGGTAGPTSPSP
jgi:flavin reductase ActVB